MFNIDLLRLRRDYSKYPLVDDEYITKEEFGYLYLELNMSFKDIDIYLNSKPGTALNKNRRKPNAKVSDKFGFKKDAVSVAAHMRQSFTDKTGLTSVMQRKDVQEKVAQKNKENWVNNKEEILSKMKNTMNERYGVDNAMQVKDFQEQAIQTKIDTYGNGNNNEKIKQTKLERYGDSTYLNHEKAKQTCLEKYNAVTPFANEEIQNKSKETLKAKYGVDNVFKLKEFQDKAVNKRIETLSVPFAGEQGITNFEDYNKEFVEKTFIKDNYFMLEDALDYFNVNVSSMNVFKRKNNITVPNKHTKHQLQNQIYDYIKSIYDKDVICDTRKVIEPLELDIYIPDKQIAIEFDGLKYHSVSNVEEDNIEAKSYHIKKTLDCREKNIKLFHIFENEWLDEKKQSIWKSVIANALNIHNEVIYARQCDLRKVSNKEKTKFLEDNHLQGDCSSSVNLGLYYKNELVSLMTFGKSRFNKSYEYELLRFCNKKNCQVRFAASRLLKNFVRDYSGSIISYANQRWSDGDLYRKLGFNLLNSKVEPSYYYFTLRDKKLLSRNSCQKHILKERLQNFDESLTESENMFTNGFRKIYDCGSLSFSYTLIDNT